MNQIFKCWNLQALQKKKKDSLKYNVNFTRVPNLQLDTNLHVLNQNLKTFYALPAIAMTFWVLKMHILKTFGFKVHIFK